MALGKRTEQQQEMWIASTELPRSLGHPFYERLNQLLADAHFDTLVEGWCQPYYADGVGRPSIPPGVYFRMLLIGYFEGLDSQRGIAWRCSDSLSLRSFLGLTVTERTPDHSSLTVIRNRLPLSVHEEVFRLVMRLAEERKLLGGKTVAVDATFLEANAAMKTIVRKDTGEDWQEYLRRLAAEAGIEDPTDEELRRFDRQRKDKKVSNAEWESPTDPDSRIVKMKDGRTHLGYKVEHVVDLESNLIVAATVQPGDRGDPDSLPVSQAKAERNLLCCDRPVLEEMVADRGYHDTELLVRLELDGVRTYIPERRLPKGKQHRWRDKHVSRQLAFYANRRRVRGGRGRRLQRKRSEQVERTFAHVCETGGGRRTWLCGYEKVTKRYLLQTVAHNLGVLLRKLFGIGKPKGLQGEGVFALFIAWLAYWWSALCDGATDDEDTPTVFALAG